MRTKRSKKYRKIMQQYGLTFAFREPYQVLVDSHHLRAVHAFKMPLTRYLERTLQGTVKPFVTRCSLATVLQTTDLQTSKRPDFLPPPTDLPLRHCSHAEVGDGGVLAEEECLLDLLSGGTTGNQQPRNKQHFILATADPLPGDTNVNGVRELSTRPFFADASGEGFRAYVRQIPGVPIVYVKRSVMVLEELSGASLGVRRREERDKLREGLLRTGSRKRKRGAEDDDGEDEEKENQQNLEAAISKRKNKGRKVKGPNPLSVLKKKPKVAIKQARDSTIESNTHPRPGTDKIKSEAEQPKAKRRRRKHNLDGPVNAGSVAGSQETVIA